MRNLDDFTPFVQFHAPAADEIQTQHAVRETINDFMRRTQVFDHRVELHPQEGVLEYVLELGACKVMVGIKEGGVRVDGCELHPTGWARDGHHDVIRFRHDVAGCCVTVDCTWTISRDDCEIPEKMYQDYMDAVVEGSLHRLHTVFNEEDLVSASRAAQALLAYDARVAETLGRKIFNFSHSRPRMKKHGRRGRF